MDYSRLAIAAMGAMLMHTAWARSQVWRPLDGCFCL